MNLPTTRLTVLLFLLFHFVCPSKAADYRDKEIDSLIQVLDKRKVKDTTYVGILLTLAAKVRNVNFDESIIYYEQAIYLSRKLSAPRKLISSLFGVGITYGMQDKYPEAIRCFNQALQVARENNRPIAEASSYNNLGIVYKRMGEYPTSLSCYIKALAIDDSLGNENDLAITSHNIGVLFDLMKEPDKAMEYYNKALKIHEKQGNKKNMANLQNNIGIIYLDKKEYDKALQFFKTALSLHDESADKVNTMTNIGNVYYKTGEYDKAEEHLWPALKMAERNKLLQVKTKILNNLAKIKAEKGDHAKSIALAMRAKTAADSVSNFSIKANAEELLSFVYEKAGNLEKALEHFKNFNSLQDSIFNETKVRSYKSQQVMMEVYEKDKQLEAQTLNLAFLKQQVALENRWKWTLGFASIFLFIAGMLYYQKYRQRRRYSVELESKNKIITRQKKEIEEMNLQLEKRMLRAQMNPHFIFNALSSIQHFITINDKVSALHYLSHFSNMLRQILETSVNINMALKDEIELLKIYMELESLRFDKNFAFELSVDKMLDTEMYEIPTMIIQPFVENAILHGLIPKKGDKKIAVNIHEENAFICCTITDNGIGRAVAKKLRNGKPVKSPSRGISVTRQRLDLLARNFGLKTDIRYTDLKDERGKAAGTQVEIKIPKQEL